MRALLLAALLATAALPAMAPPAAACHPSLLVSHEFAGIGVLAFFDMGCSHVPPYGVCVAFWFPAGEATAYCGPVP